jgi:uncharacterized membrane protein
MTQSKPVLQRSEPGLLISVYAIGVIFGIIWIFSTPSGIFGKADAIGYAVCHRIDVRSFHIGVRQLPLCARCTGQYLGAVLGLGFLWIFGKRRSGTPPKRVIGLMTLLIVLYAIDGINSYFFLPPFLKLFPGMPHLYQPSNVLRLITGTGVGLVIAMLLYPAFWGSIVPSPDPQPAINGLRIALVMLGLGILMDLLILTGSAFILLPAALISAGGVLLLLTLVYSLILILIFRKENQFSRLSQIARYVIAGFMVAMIQIALFDMIRFIITGTWNGFLFG